MFYLSTKSFIPDKPICSVDQKKIYGVARGEVVSINCSVSANTGQDLVLHWTLTILQINDKITKILIFEN